MKVHNATYSCSVELYKQWYTLADFLPNWDISRVFFYILFAVRISEAAMDIGHYIFRVPHSSFRMRRSSEGCSVSQKAVA
jgi:hypothetical protein